MPDVAVQPLDSLPQGRHVIVLSYWQDPAKPQPGDAVIRTALKTLGLNKPMCDVAIPISSKADPSFAGITLEALYAGIPAGSVYNELAKLGATSYKIVENEEIPEWIADLWDGGQGAKDAGAVFVGGVQEIGKLLSEYGSKILIGIVITIVSYHVLKAWKEIR